MSVLSSAREGYEQVNSGEVRKKDGLKLDDHTQVRFDGGWDTQVYYQSSEHDEYMIINPLNKHITVMVLRAFDRLVLLTGRLVTSNVIRAGSILGRLLQQENCYHVAVYARNALKDYQPGTVSWTTIPCCYPCGAWLSIGAARWGMWDNLLGGRTMLSW